MRAELIFLERGAPPLIKSHFNKALGAYGARHSRRTIFNLYTHAPTCRWQIKLERLDPIREIVDAFTLDLYKKMVGAFRMTQNFRLISYRKSKARSDCFKHGALELSREGRVLIGH